MYVLDVCACYNRLDRSLTCKEHTCLQKQWEVLILYIDIIDNYSKLTVYKGEVNANSSLHLNLVTFNDDITIT